MCQSLCCTHTQSGDIDKDQDQNFSLLALLNMSTWAFISHLCIWDKKKKICWPISSILKQIFVIDAHIQADGYLDV